MTDEATDKNPEDFARIVASIVQRVEAAEARLGIGTMNAAHFRTIAVMLDKLAKDAIDVLHAQLNAERVPNAIRVPVWEALAQYASEMAEECKR